MPITNGTFNTDTSGWTPISGSLSVVAGRMRVTNSAAANAVSWQAVTVVIGQLYRITWDAFSGSAPPVFRVGNTNTGYEYLSDAAAGAGQSATFTPTQTTIYVACWVGDTTAGDYADFDNISLTIPATVTDGVSSHDVQVIGYPVTLAQSFGTPDFISAIRSYPQTLTDGISVHDALLSQLGVVVAELLTIQETMIPNQFGHLSLVDSIFAHDAIARGLPLTITDGIGVQLVQGAAQLISIIEALGLSDIVAPAALYNLSVSEQLSLADSLVHFIGAGIIENLQFVEVVSGSALKPSAITDGVGLTPSIDGRLLLRAIVAESVDISDADLVQMIFNAGLIEGVEIVGAYVGPNGSITTWAMNTRTGGVTEYQNYAFNSFAQIGNKYLGASDSGLYELLGDNDDGTSIVATIRSGFAQWAGTHLGSFKAAYLAIRGAGTYVLKIITFDGNTYVYNVVASEGRSAKVILGKGLRSRYFAFELVSSGQDFDLDTLEFVPLVANRRV